MANLIVKDPPTFTSEIHKTEKKEFITADLENEIKSALLNNDVFLKTLAEAIQEKSNTHIENNSIHVTSQDKENWSGKAGTAVATQESDGLESAADKRKLDGMAAGAEVNQYAFSNVKAGNVTVSANGKTATFTLEAGANITISADNANKKIVITANKDGGNADLLDGYHAEHFAIADHGHDGRYYTKTESDNLLNQKAAANHNHNGSKHLAGQGVNGGYSFVNDGAYDTGMFSDSDGDLYFMQNGTKWYASHSDHEHDGRYYTESEVTNLLSGKAAADHGHDGRYYTKTESDKLLNQKANSSHSHNGIYYTKDEINNRLDGQYVIIGEEANATGKINWSGGHTIYSMAIGNNTIATGNGTIAIGGSAEALGDGYYGDSLALGGYARANFDGMALGTLTEAFGERSVAVGRSVESSGKQAVALGAYAKAYGENSVAIGEHAETSNANSIQLGNSASLSSITARVSLTVTSDERDKADITEVENGAIEFLNKIKAIRYVWNGRQMYIDEGHLSDEDKKNRRKYGLCTYDKEAHAAGTKKGSRIRVGISAQKIQVALKEVYGDIGYANLVNDNFFDFQNVPEGVENQLTVNYEGFIPFLIKAIQELKQIYDEEIKHLKEEIILLKNKKVV